MGEAFFHCSTISLVRDTFERRFVRRTALVEMRSNARAALVQYLRAANQIRRAEYRECTFRTGSTPKLAKQPADARHTRAYRRRFNFNPGVPLRNIEIRQIESGWQSITFTLVFPCEMHILEEHAPSRFETRAKVATSVSRLNYVADPGVSVYATRCSHSLSPSRRVHPERNLRTHQLLPMPDTAHSPAPRMRG